MTSRTWRFFIIGMATVTVLLLLTAVVKTGSAAATQTRFETDGWPGQMAGVIAGNQVASLWHAFALAALLTLFSLAWIKYASRLPLRARAVLSLVPVLLVAVDGWMLSRHYFKEMPGSYIAHNDVTRFLRAKAPHDRIALASTQSFYGIWQTYLFPYRGFHLTSAPAMPRMPDDYQAFLDAVGNQPLKMWRIWAARHLLGPKGLEEQLPSGVYRTVARFDVGMDANGELVVQGGTNAHHVIMECVAPSARLALVGGVEKVASTNLLTRLADPTWQPLQTALVSDNVAVPDLGEAWMVGEINVQAQRPDYLALRTTSEKDAILRIAERYHPSWVATVDGEKAEVFPVDFICQGLYVPAGLHTVTLRYAPGGPLPYLQISGCLLFIAGVVWSIRQSVRRQSPDRPRAEAVPPDA